jgi:hypothetical protein
MGHHHINTFCVIHKKGICQIHFLFEVKSQFYTTLFSMFRYKCVLNLVVKLIVKTSSFDVVSTVEMKLNIVVLADHLLFWMFLGHNGMIPVKSKYIS